MDLQGWGHVSTKLLVLVTLLQLFMESAQGNGICTKNELVPKTRTVAKTHTVSYLSNNRRCKNRAYSNKFKQLCVLHRTAITFKEESYNEQTTVTFCCPGFEKGTETSPLTCKPVCNPPCLNSVCIAPDQCQCYPNFTKSSGTENICEPVCSESCENGYCSSPEVCSCNAGYQLDPSHQYKCEPVCTTPCVNAVCSSPDVCSCRAGYRKTAEDSHECRAHCSTPCLNALCTAPEECTCLEGYKTDNNNINTCLPVCAFECANGSCTGPNFCTCFDGFRLVDNYFSCEPVCKDGCRNAFCSAPDHCTCFPGYEADDEDKSTCTPVCSQDCVNANCTAPDVCECSVGFEQTDDPSICKPVCSDGCKNAVCTEPEVCTCLWGYQADTQSSGCSKESEQHDCSFVNTLIEYSYNNTCFLFGSSELKIGELTDCKILQEMLEKQNWDSYNTDYLILKCDSASSFTMNEDSLDLGIVCEVVLEDERTSTSMTTDSTTEQTQYFETDVSYSTVDELFLSSGIYSSTQLTSSQAPEETFQTSANTYTKTNTERNKSRDKKSVQSKFEIILNKSTDDIFAVNGQKIPLNLNITLQFLPVIASKEITDSYFDRNSTNNTSLDQEWCLCDDNNRPRKLCAKKTTQAYFCPCTASDFEAHVTGNATMIQATIKGLAIFALVTLILR